MPYRDEEKNREYHQHYREAHKDKARVYSAEYRKQYPEREKERNRRWRETRGPIVEEDRRVREYPETVECMECHRHFAFLGRHLAKHSMTTEEYQSRFPGAPMLIDTLSSSRSKSSLSRALRNTYNGQEPDAKLFSFLLGTMLGDGSLERRKLNARYADASSNEAYATWKYEFLKAYLPTTITRRISQPHKMTGHRYTAWFVRTSSHPLLTEWHMAWYPDHKRVSRELVLQHLDSFALAIWFFDDGNNSQNRIYLYPLGFELPDVEWLSALLLTRFGLETSIGKNKRGQALIHILARSTQKFLALVQPHVAPGMDYKITGRK